MRDLALLRRARALREIGDLDQALDDINRVISSVPDAICYFLRANIHRARGSLLQSVDDYARANRLEPNWAGVLVSRAEVYELLGKMAEAENDRATVEAAARRRQEPQGEAEALDEAREFLALLERQGVRLEVRPDGRDFKLRGEPVRYENYRTFERLKPQLLRLLTTSRPTPPVSATE